MAVGGGGEGGVGVAEGRSRCATESISLFPKARKKTGKCFPNPSVRKELSCNFSRNGNSSILKSVQGENERRTWGSPEGR